jgi:hypothetical protein
VASVCLIELAQGTKDFDGPVVHCRLNAIDLYIVHAALLQTKGQKVPIRLLS